jgi:hypothetical protein
MTRSRSLIPFALSFLLSACASAGGTLMPLGPEHPASADAPEVAVADPSAVLRVQEPSFGGPAPSEAPAQHAAGAYVCPMHPEVAFGQPGRCPKCGMKLVAREEEEHGEHDHDG